MKVKSKMRLKPVWLLVLPLVLSILIAFTAVGGSAFLSAQKANLSYNGRFFSDYNSIEEVHAAATELNAEIVGEGAVLMKNDGVLPLNAKQHRLSVFGVRSGDLKEAVDGTVVGENTVASTATGLRNAGFTVNPVLEKWYENIPAADRAEGREFGVDAIPGKNFSEDVTRSFDSFGGAAVVVIQRVQMKENRDASTSLTGNTTNTGADINDKVNGPLAGNRATDGPRQIQDAVVGDDETAPYGWKHANPSVAPAVEGQKVEGTDIDEDTIKDADGNVEVKHELQLTNSEIALIDYVKGQFDRVVVLFNSSHTFEAYNLEHDPQINAMLWFGRPGMQEGGITAVAKILSGEINPSGGHSAEFVRDFTADPTWMNNGTGRQFRYKNGIDSPGDFVYRYEDEGGKYLTIAPAGTGVGGIRGVDYEEGIYLGYKYYETYWWDTANGKTELSVDKDKYSEANQAKADEWHDFNVVYPFGYGLSYTDFKFDMGEIYTNRGLTNKLGAETDGAQFASSVDTPAKVKKLYIPVTVTNIGGTAGKETVEIYATAPYISGGIEKSFVKLVGFKKTDKLLPGKSQTVVVTVDVQDIASFDYNDANKNNNSGWELDKGEYTLRAMNSSSMLRAKRDNVYGERKFTITAEKAVNLKLDNFSDKVSEPVFSDPDSTDYSIRKGGDKAGYANASADAGMIQLSRTNMDGTFPAPPSVKDLTLKNSVIEAQKNAFGRTAANNYKGFDLDGQTQPWYIPDSEFTDGGKYADWTQAASHGKGEIAEILLKDMAGIPLSDTEQWDAFMNQLTYAEMVSAINGSGVPAISFIDKAQGQNKDRPNNLGGTFTWADAPLRAATWNTELIYRFGQLIGEFALHSGNDKNSGNVSGWWGDGANINRSQFAGRTKEYYSQDGILCGIMAAASTAGAQNKGCNVYIKHFALYDQEDMNAGTTVWVNEQAMRENYLSAFRKTFQDGGASSGMVSCWRIGQTQIVNSYALMTKILRDEWGWRGDMVTDHAGGQRGEKWTNPLAAEGVTDYNWVDGNFNNCDVVLRTGGIAVMGASMAGGVKGTWNPELRNKKGGVELTLGTGDTAETVTSNIQWYYVRKTAMEVLYQSANSQTNFNGVARRNFVAKTGENVVKLKQGTPADVAGQLGADDLNGGSAVYNVQSGKLPAGLTLDTATGAITGTPTEVITEDHVVEIRVVVDGWIKKTVEYAFKSDSAFTAELPEATVGATFSGSIFSDITGGSGAEVYSIAEGTLPSGLSLNSETGEITGTPADPGSYEFAVSYKRGEGAEYTSEKFVITVGGTAAAPESPEGSVVKVEVNDADDLVITYENGYSQNIGKITGAQGEAGADGTKWLSGSTAPEASAGVSGDWYINTETFEIFEKTGDAWTSRGVIKGTDGKDGQNGKDGVDGKDGKDGKDVEPSGCGSAISSIGIAGGIAALALVGAVIVLAKRRSKKD